MYQYPDIYDYCRQLELCGHAPVFDDDCNDDDDSDRYDKWLNGGNDDDCDEP